VEEMRNSHDKKIETIEFIAKIVREYNLGKLTYKSGDLVISCELPVQQVVSHPTHHVVQNVPNQGMSNQLNQPNKVETEVTEIKSDMVGTIYLSSSPADSPYIHIGSKVTKGQTIFIIEAMKVMNHFKATHDGTVKEILVRNEQVVEYGQPLVRLV
jgi:acetyl-CoA carboxylase biotin carboxyl carrier protein